MESSKWSQPGQKPVFTTLESTGPPSLMVVGMAVTVTVMITVAILVAISISMVHADLDSIKHRLYKLEDRTGAVEYEPTPTPEPRERT